MTDLTSRLDGLSDKQRAVLELRLRQKRAESPRSPIARRAADGDALPLSFAQQRLWFLDQLNPGSATYNVHAALRLRGRLDLPTLERTLAEIQRRHEVLRTTFDSTDGHPTLVVHPPAPLSLPIADLCGLGAEERERAVRRAAHEEMMRPFDLARGPLMRAGLLRLGADEYVLLFTLHHIVSDGWALFLFIEELSVLYDAFGRGEPSPLPELPIQYSDYARWQRELLRGERLEAELAYWRAELAGAPPRLNMPTDFTRPAQRTNEGATQVRAFARPVLDAARALAVREGVTLYMLLLAAYNVLLGYHTSQEDILVGTPVSDRSMVECERLMGCFLNTMVLRTDLSGDPSFRELLRRVREKVLGAHSHRHLPFERLVDELQPERSLNENPIFQVSFTLENSMPQPPRLTGVGVTFIEPEAGAAQFDLVLHMVDSTVELLASMQYSTELWKPSTIEGLLRHYGILLGLILERPDLRLSELKAALAGDDRARRLEREKSVESASLSKLKSISRRPAGRV